MSINKKCYLCIINKNNMEKILERIVKLIKHDLRDCRKESVYATSKASGLRPDVINSIESESAPLGRAQSLCTYIDSYSSRYPASAYKMFYNAAIEVAQTKLV